MSEKDKKKTIKSPFKGLSAGKIDKKSADYKQQQEKLKEEIRKTREFSKPNSAQIDTLFDM